MKLITALIATMLLAACASYSGSGLKPGVANLEQVQALMGQPAMRWQDADGSVQLAYPRGPYGYHTYMVKIGSDGRLQSIENVLEDSTFRRIVPGLSKEEVLRLLGPPNESRSVYNKARNELAWEWRFRDAFNEPARYVVLFDASAGTVRSAMVLREYMERSFFMR
ncbi:MAG: hypothetical protein IH606_14780 [Burkholderiales bacterium]|nr:hypothetical protein [Burkholderiales bacterium]